MDKFILGIMIVLCFFVIFGWYFDSITGLFVNKDITEKKEITQLISERLCDANPKTTLQLLTALNDTENIRRLNQTLPKFVMLAETPPSNLTYTTDINWCGIGKEEIIENYGTFVLQANYILFRTDMDEKTAFGYAVIDLFDKVLIGADIDKRKELAVELAKTGYLKSMDSYIGFLSETLGPQLGKLLFEELTEKEKNDMADVLLIAIGYLR